MNTDLLTLFIMTKDPVLVREKEIIKEKGKIEAIKYLSSEALKHPQFSELFYKYFFRSIGHSIGINDLQDQVEDSLLGFIEYYESKKEFPDEYLKLCDFLFRHYVILKDGNNAKNTACRLNNMLTSNPYNYLLIYKEVLEKSQIASDLFNVKQERKDSDYLYYMIMVQLIDIAWHLNCDWGSNMEWYFCCINTPRVCKPRYTKFDVYNNIKWDIDDELFEEEDFIYEYFDESDVSIFERAVINFNPESFIRDLHNLYFVDFPKNMGFKLEFLDLEYDNIMEFGEWFNKNQIGKNNFSSKAVGVANDLANDFLKKYISK